MRINEAVCLLAGYGANINPNNPVAEAVKMGIEALERLSSAQPKSDEWCSECKEYDHEKHCCPRFNRVIRETVEEIHAERKKGEWIIDEDCEGKSRTVTCNLCGYEEFNWHNPNFCPNCGADMRGEQDE